MIALPPLPKHLESLLDGEWTPEKSRLLDQWLRYIELEFAGEVEQ